MFEFRRAPQPMPRRPTSFAVSYSFVVALAIAASASAAEPFRYTAAKQGSAELKLIEGLPVIVVTGTPEEMGQQVGALSAASLQSLLGHQKQIAHGFGLSQSKPLWSAAGSIMLPRFPPDQRRELDAMAKAAGLDPDLLVFANVMYDWSRLGGCSAQMVEPARSATGGVLFGRDFDFPTFGFLDQYSLVVVYRPKGKHAFASVTFPGLVGVVSGINDAGLCLAELEVNSSKDAAPGFDPAGVPVEMCFRRMLEECKTLDEAEKLLRSIKPSTMCNLAICDTHSAAVLEITPRHVVRRAAVDSLCSCTNHFRSTELATSTQCWRYDRLEGIRNQAKLGLNDLAKQMNSVSQGRLTIQTMIFEPSARALYLSLGPAPSSARRLKKLDLAALFGEPAAK
jgi:isopenicillin-N N-acyltransferase like protein